MTHSNKTEDRDEVLYAFHQECAKPTSEQIIAWSKRFPQFAEDIRAHAAVAWDWAATDNEPVEVEETLSGQAYSQALNIIFSAEHHLRGENAEQGAKIERLREGLRRIEWSEEEPVYTHNGVTIMECCPTCRGRKPTHGAWCWLAKLLEEK